MYLNTCSYTTFFFHYSFDISATVIDFGVALLKTLQTRHTSFQMNHRLRQLKFKNDIALKLFKALF